MRQVPVRIEANAWILGFQRHLILRRETIGREADWNTEVLSQFGGYLVCLVMIDLTVDNPMTPEDGYGRRGGIGDFLRLSAQWDVCAEHEKPRKVSSGCQRCKTCQGATLAETPYYNPFWRNPVVLDLSSNECVKSGGRREKTIFVLGTVEYIEAVNVKP